MSPRPLVPGVSSAGHIADNGFWHPGRIDGCLKCPAPDERPRAGDVRARAGRTGATPRAGKVKRANRPTGRGSA